MKVKGLKEVQSTLKNIEENSKALNGQNTVPFEELFTNQFLLENSKFKSYEEFSSGEVFKKYESLEEIPNEEMDKYILDNTNFKNWEDFSATAAQIYVVKKLGF